jgi:thioredoxin reductase (NADPH)
VIPGQHFTVRTEEGGAYLGKSVILSVGVKHRTLGLPGEEALIGNGISFCAVCDGAFYTDQDVVMIGGGNSAMQEALLLSEVCRKVTIVQNLPFFTGEKKLAEALEGKENVEIHFSTLVDGYLAENGTLTGVRVKQETGKVWEIPADGVFLAVGLQPENDAFAPLAQLDERGYFDTDEFCVTKTPGLFVAGDCRRKQIRQVTTAAADGAVAAMAACRYLEQ